MTREEHIQWCKRRAIEDMDYSKDPKQAIVSMMSDLRKHPETDSETLAMLCMMVLMSQPNLTRQGAIDFINGFN